MNTKDSLNIEYKCDLFIVIANPVLKLKVTGQL